jgi:predicted phage tail protein
MLATHEHPKDLNTWGDFFAGFFAPLAFLGWFLGTFQQGEELKHSTDALHLQAEELRNSVEQQSQLVAVSRDQMKQELGALVEERELRREAARPRFVPQLSGSIAGGLRVTYTVKLVNVGNTATKLRVTFRAPSRGTKALQSSSGGPRSGSFV